MSRCQAMRKAHALKPVVQLAAEPDVLASYTNCTERSIALPKDLHACRRPEHILLPAEQ